MIYILSKDWKNTSEGLENDGVVDDTYCKNKF